MTAAEIIRTILLLPKKLLVTKEQRKRRLNICTGEGKARPCPSFLSTTRQCGECDCFLDLKSWLKNERCDLKKW